MIPVFAIRLICGLSSVWCLASRRQITSGFFRIQMLLVLGLSVLVTVTSSQYPAPPGMNADTLQAWIFGGGLGLSVLAFAGSIAWTLERRGGGTWVTALILLTSLFLALMPIVRWPPSPQSSAVSWQLANALTSAWILGASTGAMLLGHWYLTATGMALTPLVNYCRVFSLAVVLRILAAVGMSLGMSASGFGGNWTLQVLRWGGLIGPLVLAGLALRILKYRNTQSTTGVLYAATILVFMGEMASGLLQADG